MNQQPSTQPRRSGGSPMGVWIAVGIIIGAAIGVTMNNLAIGIAIGLIFGGAIEAIIQRGKDDKDGR